MSFADSTRKVCIRFSTDLDLSGWSAKFILLDTIKENADIGAKIWTFTYTADETRKFPLGKTFAKLVVTDAVGQVRRMAKVSVEVVDYIEEPCIEGTISISIDNLLADYDILENKPRLNGHTIEGNHDAEFYGIHTNGHYEQEIQELAGQIEGLKDGDIPVARLLFVAQGDTANYYRLQMVMRPNGSGQLVPALSIDALPIEDTSDDSQSME